MRNRSLWWRNVSCKAARRRARLGNRLRFLESSWFPWGPRMRTARNGKARTHAFARYHTGRSSHESPTAVRHASNMAAAAGLRAVGRARRFKGAHLLGKLPKLARSSVLCCRSFPITAAGQLRVRAVALTGFPFQPTPWDRHRWRAQDIVVGRCLSTSTASVARGKSAIP